MKIDVHEGGGGNEILVYKHLCFRPGQHKIIQKEENILKEDGKFLVSIAG